MHVGGVSGNKKGGVQLGLAFILRGQNMHFLTLVYAALVR